MWHRILLQLFYKYLYSRDFFVIFQQMIRTKKDKISIHMISISMVSMYFYRQSWPKNIGFSKYFFPVSFIFRCISGHFIFMMKYFVKSCKILCLVISFWVELLFFFRHIKNLVAPSNGHDLKYQPEKFQV